MLWSIAQAQSTVAATAAKPGMLEMFFPVAVMLFIVYMFFLRPQQKKVGDHQKFLTSLKRGDQVITNSGIYGEVTGLTDKVVTLEVADNVRIKVLKSQVLATAKEGTI